MTIDLLKNIFKSCPKSVPLLGMDMGEKTIGLAVSDADQSIAMPLKTIQRQKFSQDILKLETCVKEYEIGGFIIGYPLNMDGSEGRRCQSIRDFSSEFSHFSHIVGETPWIAFWDERLSSHHMETFLVDEMDMSRKKRKEIIDKLAAQHILQGALGFLREMEEKT